MALDARWQSEPVWLHPRLRPSAAGGGRSAAALGVDAGEAPLAGGADLGASGLTITAVPEPAAGLLAVGGLILVTCSAMRRRIAAREGERRSSKMAGVFAEMM